MSSDAVPPNGLFKEKYISHLQVCQLLGVLPFLQDKKFTKPVMAGSVCNVFVGLIVEVSVIGEEQHENVFTVSVAWGCSPPLDFAVA